MSTHVRVGAGLAGAATVLLLLGAAQPVAAADDPVDEPDTFTSMFTTTATPDVVVNPQGAPTPGEAGATGIFNYRVNSDEEIICYDITLRGVTPPYMSMARTATHLHEAAVGVSGPPRISFPNPEDAGDGTLTSKGCVKGPFVSGIIGPDGADTGAGFTLAEFEADPANYYSDTHTMTYVAGAVRGQMTAVPMGGVDTGAGGTAGDDGNSAIVPIGLVGLAAVGGAAALLIRRRGVANG
ncbi:MAG: CHRD domain-containing protein [Ilumatobacteraceae bacterium]